MERASSRTTCTRNIEVERSRERPRARPGGADRAVVELGDGDRSVDPSVERCAMNRGLLVGLFLGGGVAGAAALLVRHGPEPARAHVAPEPARGDESLQLAGELQALKREVAGL